MGFTAPLAAAGEELLLDPPPAEVVAPLGEALVVAVPEGDTGLPAAGVDTRPAVVGAGVVAEGGAAAGPRSPTPLQAASQIPAAATIRKEVTLLEMVRN